MFKNIIIIIVIIVIIITTIIIIAIIIIWFSRTFLHILAVPNKTLIYNCPISAAIPIYFSLVPNNVGTILTNQQPRVHSKFSANHQLDLYINLSFPFPSPQSFFLQKLKINDFASSILLINYNQIWFPGFYYIFNLNNEIRQALLIVFL